MTKKRAQYTLAALAAIVLLLLASGCMGNPRSETIVIPGTEEDQMNAGVTGQSFRVNTIYRLPISTTTKALVLGWTNQADVVGLFLESRPLVSNDGALQLQRLAPPYEQITGLQAAAPDTNLYALSPDGRRIAGISKSKTGSQLTITSLPDGQLTKLDAPPNGQWRLTSRSLKWSSNSRFVSYLVSGESRDELRVVVCDTSNGTVKLYPLTGFQAYGYALSAAMSDDGKGALIDTGKTVAMAKRDGEGFAVQYDHPSAIDESAWVNNDQFAFLGLDGTLFQYDGRNGELSVLMEKVGSFRLSPDRKLIAYTQNEKDTIFAGRLQGNNVLYQEAVYQGVYPFQMIWSPSGGALLIDGRKQYARSAEQSMSAPETMPDNEQQPFIIQFR